jgi:organic radical activating enzyme
MFLAEIFNSWQGEGGSVEGSAFGRRQIFVRFAGCDLFCWWCDSKQYLIASQVPKYRYEIKPFSGRFEYKNNPAKIEDVINIILNLDTGDIHSISYTGGEPTLQTKSLKELMDKMREVGFKNYLETNGSQPQKVKEVAYLTDYACVDIKDETARAAKDWRDLVLREIESIKILKEHNVKVFAKLVVTKDTKAENIRWYAELLKGTAPMVIQPKEPIDISQKQLMKFYNIIAGIMGKENVGLSFQVHKYLGVL